MYDLATLRRKNAELEDELRRARQANKDLIGNIANLSDAVTKLMEQRQGRAPSYKYAYTFADEVSEGIKLDGDIIGYFWAALDGGQEIDLVFTGLVDDETLPASTLNALDACSVYINDGAAPPEIRQLRRVYPCMADLVRAVALQYASKESSWLVNIDCDMFALYAPRSEEE